MRAVDVRVMDLGPDPSFGLDPADAWAAVLSLHGDDGYDDDDVDDWQDDWRDRESEDLDGAIGPAVEDRADTIVEPGGDGAVTDEPTPAPRAPRPVS